MVSGVTKSAVTALHILTYLINIVHMIKRENYLFSFIAIKIWMFLLSSHEYFCNEFFFIPVLREDDLRNGPVFKKFDKAAIESAKSEMF